MTERFGELSRPRSGPRFSHTRFSRSTGIRRCRWNWCACRWPRRSQDSTSCAGTPSRDSTSRARGGSLGGERSGVWDAALAFLTLSTLGAWGVGVVHAMSIQDPIWTAAPIHFYLGLFSEGWFVLGVLGVAVARLDPSRETWGPPLLIVAGGLPFSFLMALPSAHLSGGVMLLGQIGGGLVGTGLLLITVRLGRPVMARDVRWLWGLPLLALGMKAAGQLGGALVRRLWLSDHPDLRVLYLHLMLLGVVSMGSWRGQGKWGPESLGAKSRRSTGPWASCSGRS